MFNINCSAIEVAKYILWYCEDRCNHPISNLKLQKILYYVQGKYVANFRKPLFYNRIEAWDYGPVVPDVYFEFGEYNSKAIKNIKPIDFNLFNEKDETFINKIVESLVYKDVWDIVEQTHSEDPWKYSYMRGRNEEISIWDLKDWFEKH
ncbi:Panacea domain-containing protein [Clostridioides sp. GD02377]|uniref:Panacea domain-containing protein n=1 Tax=unclassified Clostridioides TaxID=2635829 RepID=UPI0038B17109